MSGRKRYYKSLSAWLTATKQNPRDVAPSLGVSASYLYYILEGKRKPGRELISRLALVGVDPMSFLSPTAVMYPNFSTVTSPKESTEVI